MRLAPHKSTFVNFSAENKTLPEINCVVNDKKYLKKSFRDEPENTLLIAKIVYIR